jgi:hypothetical protein
MASATPSEVIAVRIPSTMATALDHAALQLGLRRSDLIRWSINAVIRADQALSTTIKKETNLV